MKHLWFTKALFCTLKNQPGAPTAFTFAKFAFAFTHTFFFQKKRSNNNVPAASLNWPSITPLGSCTPCKTGPRHPSWQTRHAHSCPATYHHAQCLLHVFLVLSPLQETWNRCVWKGFAWIRSKKDFLTSSIRQPLIKKALDICYTFRTCKPRIHIVDLSFADCSCLILPQWNWLSEMKMGGCGRVPSWSRRHQMQLSHPNLNWTSTSTEELTLTWWCLTTDYSPDMCWQIRTQVLVWPQHLTMSSQWVHRHTHFSCDHHFQWNLRKAEQKQAIWSGENLASPPWIRMCLWFTNFSCMVDSWQPRSDSSSLLASGGWIWLRR